MEFVFDLKKARVHVSDHLAALPYNQVPIEPAYLLFVDSHGQIWRRSATGLTSTTLARLRAVTQGRLFLPRSRAQKADDCGSEAK
jgi:hypothetical protein